VIVVDASALVAIARQEPEQAQFEGKILSASHVHISVVSVFEASMVIYSRGGEGPLAELDAIIDSFGLIIEPVRPEHLHYAREGFSRFGKGQGSPARLNMGDCFSYALARAKGLPLLFKGTDFSLTDVMPA
jgi:ribonuclease VapC